MSRFAHHASRRAVEIESEFEHARYIAVPALLWAVAVVAAVAAVALQDVPASAPVQAVSPEDVPTVPFGA